MTTEEEFKEEVQSFERSWNLIKNVIPWLNSHYHDPRNRDNSGRIQTRSDLVLIDMHLKDMQRLVDKWKSDYP